MATAPRVPLVSIEQYLQTTFRPDVDYVDGSLEERNVGEFDHGDVQWALLEALNAYTPTLGIRARPEVRVQVGPTRFRVPDVCVVGPAWKRTQVITDPPLLCVEILSPGDRLNDAIRRGQEYLAMGVPEVWVVDPRARSLVVATGSGIVSHLSGSVMIPTTSAALKLDSVFAVLEQ